MHQLQPPGRGGAVHIFHKGLVRDLINQLMNHKGICRARDLNRESPVIDLKINMNTKNFQILTRWKLGCAVCLCVECPL